MVAPAKAPVALIQLRGAEVPGSPEATAHSWEEADTVLAAWGTTAPLPRHGYHKVDFHILFSNGTEYEGCFDLQRSGRESDSATLQQHVHAFALCYAGRCRPLHLTPDGYQDLLKRLGQEDRDFYASVLDTCDVGPAPPPPLMDATALAREAGIRYPVLLTRSVWDRYVKVPEGIIAQDETGRLWDILWVYRSHARHCQDRVLPFTVFVRNDNVRPRPIRLTAACHPDDAGNPYITIIGSDES